MTNSEHILQALKEKILSGEDSVSAVLSDLRSRSKGGEKEANQLLQNMCEPDNNEKQQHVDQPIGDASNCSGGRK